MNGVTENPKALTSWSGYVYQGMIAILTAIRELNENPIVNERCTLELEKIDDFSIRGDGGAVVSIHQVKCKKTRTAGSYSDAVRSLEDKRQTMNGVNAYLHTSVQVNGYTNTNVNLYHYDGNQSYMPILSIERSLFAEINKYVTRNITNITVSDSDLKLITSALNELVRDRVREAHAENMVRNVSLTNINRNVPFSDIVAVINDFEFGQYVNEQACISYFKSYLALKTKNYIVDEELGNEEEGNVSDTVEKVSKLEDGSFVKFLKILVPTSSSDNLKTLSDVMEFYPTGFDVPFLMFISATVENGEFHSQRYRYEAKHEDNLFTPYGIADSNLRNKVSFANKLYRSMFDNKEIAEFYYKGDVIVSKEVEIENLLAFTKENSPGAFKFPREGKNFNEPKEIRILNVVEALKLINGEDNEE